MMKAPGTLAILAPLAILLALTGCDVIADALPSPGLVSRQTAEDTARFSAGVSLASIEVVSSRVSTYGAEHPGGTLAAPDLPVWAVVLSGAFPVGSCLVVLFPSAPASTPRTCPTPAPRERAIVNARNGRLVEMIPGG